MANVKTSVVRVLVIAVVLVLAAAVSLAAGAGGAEATVASVTMPVTLMGAVLVFAIQWLAFIPAFIWQTERYYDLVGSISFVSLVGLLVWQTNTSDPRALLVGAMVVLWAVRLGSFLFARILQDGKDTRFNHIKPQPLRFLLTWNMQGLWVMLTTAPVMAVISHSNEQALGVFAVLGTAMWLVGWMIESVADHQKRQFKRAQPSQPFIDTGLWAISRHPNYFGEILLWTGVACVALPVLNGWQYATLISPVFVFLLLTRVSGVPLLEASAEKKWGDLPAYQAYKQKTPVLVPFVGKP